MKKLPSIKAIGMAIIVTVCFNLIYTHLYQSNDILIHIQTSLLNMGSYQAPNVENNKIVVELASIDVDIIDPIVYDNMTLTELSAKLDRTLKSTLSGKGYAFAKLSLDYGVDPYVAVAIVLLETGCNSGTCSTLCRECNNVGGMKGSPGCGGGSYKRFNTLEEGIEAYIKNLSNNYYKKGLVSVEQIGRKYAESQTWPEKVYNYINKIKNS